jgi:hypothetical protein
MLTSSRSFTKHKAVSQLTVGRRSVSLRSVQRIWAAHDLQPHRLRSFKRSTDPEFAAKLEDMGLYVAPPKHAVVLSVDEKSHV